MSDLKRVLAAASDLRHRKAPFVVATVVCVKGSAYRRPGARMLLTEDRWIAGSVSGGCLESDLLRKAFWRTEKGEPVVVTYDQTSEEDELRAGVGCDGVIELLLERFRDDDPTDPLRFAEACVQRQLTGALVTVFKSSHESVQPGARLGVHTDGSFVLRGLDSTLARHFTSLAEEAIEQRQSRALDFVDPAHPDRKLEILVELIEPPPRLFVFGAGHDAAPVAQLAVDLGWDVLVWEKHTHPSTAARFPSVDRLLSGDLNQVAALIDTSDRALAVVMNHDIERDRDAFAMLLRTRARYIGLLGPRRRAEKIAANLRRADALSDPRVHAPIGLEIGAETPVEIALAMTAEMHASLAGTRGRPLRERSRPIHAAEALLEVR